MAVLVLCVSDASARTLSFQERVAAQRAIEQVYWSHRIWPQENSQPKPALSTILPEATLEGRVENALRESNALAERWKHPITAEAMQAEIDRLVRDSQQPQMLKEIFTALNDDPFLIAECLGRSLLADSWLRTQYGDDPVIHAGTRARAEKALLGMASVEDMKSPGGGGTYFEVSFMRGDSDAASLEPSEGQHNLDPDEWNRLLETLSAAYPGTEARAFALDGVPLLKDLTGPGRVDRSMQSALPARTLSGLQENRNSFFIVAVLERSDDALKIASVVWRKTPFENWWAQERSRFPLAVESSVHAYSLMVPGTGSCTDDTWSQIAYTGPTPRFNATAVWTGSEMLVWGGDNSGTSSNFLADGGRYDPATDTWRWMSLVNAPSARTLHTAVWTGTEMIVWGGLNADNSEMASGARYDPSADAWSPTSTGANLPAARSGHTAVWTGTEMIIWGGLSGGTYFNTGGAYRPSTNTWRATSLASAPTGRSRHAAVWTGSMMIVYGGDNPSATNTGGRYTPGSDTWAATSTGANVPSARDGFTAVWTGTQMVIWGGSPNPGGRYNPVTNTWLTTSLVSAPSARLSPSGVWSGTDMIVWGGFDPLSSTYLNSGGRYNPSTNTWQPTSTGAGTPVGRRSHTAIWTGSEMIVFGGQTPFYQNTGGRYSPATNSWLSTNHGANVPASEAGSSAVWTGSEMIVWGGANCYPSCPSPQEVNSGGRFTPATNSWSLTSAGPNVPAARTGHTAVWTGREMIVWGGGPQTGSPTDALGHRYDPLTDTWTLTSGTGAPAARSSHTAIWSGREMIVWGGYSTGQYLNTGSRYNPMNNTWQATALGSSVPVGRFGHTAVWTGHEMIVWGGVGAFFPPMNTGGRYDPVADAWSPTLVDGSTPEKRYVHTALWTGSKMIVFGGKGDFGLLGTGGLYDPAADSWSATSTLPPSPQARWHHTSVWTGSQMLVWGGFGNGFTIADGARYDPTEDSWTAMSGVSNVPLARGDHIAIWAVDRMILWGGGVPMYTPGASYCAASACSVSTWYRDADQDGYGNASDSVLSCDPAPQGYVQTVGDCDDSSNGVHPGGTDADCDGVDENCSGVADEGYVSISTSCGFGACAQSGQTACVNGAVQDTCTPGSPASEVCDGIDNDCDGTVDNADPPVGHPLVQVGQIPIGNAHLTWSSVAGATAYDVVRGGLGLLASSSGDFVLATDLCLFNDAAFSSDDATVPGAGEGFWYLVRPANCGGTGTYDSGSPSQQGSRDAEIQGSGQACP